MKKLPPRIIVALIIGSLSALTAPAAESLWLLLQKGIYAEETEGNLASAITIYEQIKIDGAANLSLLAQAQFRLAACHQKQGNKELAVATFNEVIRQFPTETALVQKAREQLAAMGHAAPATVTLRKVAVVDNYWFRGVSPSGRYIAYMGGNGEMFMRDLAAQKTWQPFKCNWDKQPHGFVFSPDSNRISYDLYGRGLFVSNVDGSDTRELHKPEGTDDIRTLAWLASTGKIVAVLTEAKTGTKSLVAVDPKSGALDRFNLPPLTGRNWQPSLNGRYVAFLDNGLLSVIDIESGRKKTVDDNATRGVIAWAHDDTELFFSSNRGGNRSLCVVEMRAGQPTGLPRVVREENTDLSVEFVAPDGIIYYTSGNNTGNIGVASANFETGEIVQAPRLVTNRFPGIQSLPVWSSDGQKLWFFVYGEQRRLVAVSIPSGRQEDFPVALNFRLWFDYRLSGDSNFVLVHGSRFLKPGSPATARGVHRYDLVTGKGETLANDSASGEWNRRPRFASDGKSFFYGRDARYTDAERRQREKAAILRRDLSSNKVEVVYEASAGRTLAWHDSPLEPSPDGSQLAFVSSDDEYAKEDFIVAIEVLDLATRQSRELVRMAPREYVTSLGWTSDGKRLVYTKSSPVPGDGSNSRQTSIWSTAVASGKSVRVNLSLPDVAEIAISPNGRQFAFRTGSVGDSALLWAMDGVRAGQLPSGLGPQADTLEKGFSTVMMPEEIKGPNNSIHDREFRVSMTLPHDWSLTEARRNLSAAAWYEGDGVTGLNFSLSGKQAFARTSYSLFETARPMDAAGLDAALRAWRTKHLAIFSGGFENYREREGSLVARSLPGGSALSWSADFTRQGAKWIGFWTAIRNENGHAFLFGWAPEGESESLRSGFEKLAATVRLEKRR